MTSKSLKRFVTKPDPARRSWKQLGLHATGIYAVEGAIHLRQRSCSIKPSRRIRLDAAHIFGTTAATKLIMT